MKNGYRHGDVVIIKCDSIPESAQRKCGLILAYGEITGHKHQISKGMAELFESGSTKYLRVLSETVELIHEEHKTIVLPKGDYEFKIQRTYIPQGWKNV